MSRVLKFRAWDKAEGHYWNDLLNIGTGGRPEYSCADEYFDCDEFIIEQYTGLKDKNGKGIYEGDILGGMFEGCYVGWCDTTKSFELFNCYDHYCMACDGDILWCELSDDDVDLEVIGNIYEDGKLVGEVDDEA